MSRKYATPALLLLAFTVATIAFVSPRTPQPQSYHNFADQRSWLGLPNFGDVVSNVGFAIVGIWGLWFLLRLGPEQVAARFFHPSERWCYSLVFLGMLLTALGSANYHLAPDNARLVWDRLPMTIVFMSLVTAIIADRISAPAAVWLCPLLLAIGMLSVLEWYWSERAGHGDLRLYAAVQVYAVLMLLLVLFLPSRYTRTVDLAVVVVLYVLAKSFETFDRKIFALGHLVSGHTLKHLAAALAGYWVLRMLEKRKPLRGAE